MKCVPVKCLTSGFGAVRLIRVAGWNLAPGPDTGGPSSILHDDGASTESIGTLLVSMATIVSLKGSRTSPEKLKPEEREFRKDYSKLIGSTKNGIYYIICSLQRAVKVLSEWNIQVLQLRSQTFVDLGLALFGIEDRWLVAVMPEMTGSNETIATCTCKRRWNGRSRLVCYHYCRVHMLPKSSFLCLVDEHGRLSARNQYIKRQEFDCHEPA